MPRWGQPPALLWPVCDGLFLGGRTFCVSSEAREFDFLGPFWWQIMVTVSSSAYTGKRYEDCISMFLSSDMKCGVAMELKKCIKFTRLLICMMKNWFFSLGFWKVSRGHENAIKIIYIHMEPFHARDVSIFRNWTLNIPVNCWPIDNLFYCVDVTL